jgi:hypothetical protein
LLLAQLVKDTLATEFDVDQNEDKNDEVIPDVKSKTIVSFAQKSIEKGTTILSDAYL